MATTTNYGWTTPDDTALVKDGAAAIRSLGSAVDTTMFTMVPKTTVDAKGDIIAGTADNTVARLAVGANNSVLTADSSTATGLKWAAAAGSNLQEVVFTSSNASYTIPTGVTGFWALVVGGGGGGGAVPATASRGGGGGGAGQVLEKYFAISTDTTLNITVGAGGAGGAAGNNDGGNGSTSSIVGNQSSTTFASASGGGGGGNPNTLDGVVGASGGGQANGGGTAGGAGGSMGGYPQSVNMTVATRIATFPTARGGAAATTTGVTGYCGGNTTEMFPAVGINIFGRNLAAGGAGGGGFTAFTAYGAASSVVNTAGSAATANTGSGGSGASTTAATARAGGAGGSGIVVIRYVG